LAKKFFGVSVATISAGILLLSPIFLDYTHLATQDMPLLAIELIGIYSLAMAENRKDDVHHLFSGMWIGMGFLMKGFMIFLPLIAIIPLILWRKKYLISSRLFLLGLFVGWLPVIIWISLSIREYGYTVVSNLFNNLIYL
jgi:4-amino-4-deoxy-L-arabinose transferase-like glycosyltransferase